MREIKERQYQLDQIDQVIRVLSKTRTVCMQLPTGGGKTVEFSMIVKRYTSKLDKCVLILVHRQELLHQAKQTIFEMYGINASLIVAGTKSVPYSPVYIGMVESVYTRAEFLHGLNLGLIIIDECHVANFNKMHSIFVDELIIGCTATPLSSNKKEPLKKYYSNIVCGPSIQELIAMGHLAQNITRCPEDIVDETLLTVDAKTGDFDTRKMAAEFIKPKYVMNTVRYYRNWCRGEKTMIFNVNIEHSKEVADCFKLIGIEARHIDGEMDDRIRKENLQWFKEKKDAVLCNVGIATMGFDEPTIKNIIVNLHTLSLPKWIQMCGRGSRYIAGEKTTFNIIDLGGNSVRFGDWSDQRDWAALFHAPEKVGRGGVAPVKTCPNCWGLVHAAVTVCPLKTSDGELCLHVFDRRKHEEEKKLGELKLITQNIDVQALMDEHKRNKEYFIFFELGRKHAEKLFELDREFTQKEAEVVFNEYFAKCQEWFRLMFPKKRFEREWHMKLARSHFFNVLQTRFQKAV